MRRALVTGANRGVGLAVARGLKAKGLDVVAGARNAGRAATEKIGCASVGLDVSERKSIDRAVAETGPFDILVNNAGVLFNELMLDSPEHFAESMAVMVAGPYMLVNACAPAMQSSRLWPHRQCFFRLGQFRRRAWRPGGAYGIAKAALNALTLALSRELPAPVKINATCPGWVRTRMAGAGATLSPEEGADTAIWLATLPDDGPTGGFFRQRKMSIRTGCRRS